MIQPAHPFPQFVRSPTLSQPLLPVQFDRQIDPPRGASGGGAPTDVQFPFQITESATALNVKVRYGTVMDIEPTDVATDLPLTDDATNYIYIQNTLDVDGNVTASAIGVNTTGLPTNDTDNAYILIGNVVCADGVVSTINQAITHSLRFAACGRENDGGDPPVVTVDGSYEFWGV